MALSAKTLNILIKHLADKTVLITPEQGSIKVAETNIAVSI